MATRQLCYEAAKASACVSWVHGCTMDHNHHKKYHNHHKNIVFGTNILNLRSAFLNSALTFLAFSAALVLLLITDVVEPVLGCLYF